jgi:hypothetical protein
VSVGLEISWLIRWVQPASGAAGNTTLIITIEEARSLGLRSRYSSEASNHCPHE